MASSRCISTGAILLKRDYKNFLGKSSSSESSDQDMDDTRYANYPPLCGSKRTNKSSKRSFNSGKILKKLSVANPFIDYVTKL